MNVQDGTQRDMDKNISPGFASALYCIAIILHCFYESVNLVALVSAGANPARKPAYL